MAEFFSAISRTGCFILLTPWCRPDLVWLYASSTRYEFIPPGVTRHPTPCSSVDELMHVVNERVSSAAAQRQTAAASAAAAGFIVQKLSTIYSNFANC